MVRSGRKLGIMWLALWAALGSGLLPAHALAQTPAWAPTTTIPGYLPNTLPPYMIADQNKTVHAFATQWMSDQPNDPDSQYRAIYYRQWTAAGGWTKPNDIMLSPLKKQARILGVFLDARGIFHMIFWGGDDQEANIYYSWAPALKAPDAKAWSEPIPIGAMAIGPSAAALVGDANGHLVVTYAGNLGEGNGWYAIYSADSGATWSEPQLVYSTYTLDRFIGDYQMILGDSGKVHLIWNVGDETGQNLGGFYARLDDLDHPTWTDAMPIDTNVGLGIATPALVEYNGQVFMIYNNGLADETAPRQWFRRSSDGGVTWSAPMRPFTTHIGRNGMISFAKDSAGRLHVFFGERIPATADPNSFDLHGMWHALWMGETWGPLEPIVSGPRSDNFDPYDARAVVSQGNEILLTWRTDPGRAQSNVWFSAVKLDTPELPVQPLPEPPQLASQLAQAPPVIPGAVEPFPVMDAPVEPQPVNLNFSRQPGAQPANPGLPLVIGVSAAAVLTLLGLTLGALKTARQR